MTNDDLIFQGERHNVKLPSGKIVTIRDTNGEDDARLSMVSSVSDGSNIRNFLANIITFNLEDGDMTIPDSLLSWPLSDIYYLIFKQRLYNHGTELRWELDCQNPQCTNLPPVEFTEDLQKFDNSVGKYPHGSKPILELTTSRGKTLRYKILNGELEKKMLAQAPGNSNQNTSLVSREFEIYRDGNWDLIKFWAAFSTKEMTEIRKHVRENDYEFGPKVNFVCPNCNTPYTNDIYSMPTFYWPRD